MSSDCYTYPVACMSTNTHFFKKEMLNKRSSRKWFIFWTNHNLLITTNIYWEPTMCQTLLRDKTVRDKHGRGSRLTTTAVTLNESIQGRQICWKTCPKRLNWGLHEWLMVHKARGVFEQVSVYIPLSLEREVWWGPHRKEETAQYHTDA